MVRPTRYYSKRQEDHVAKTINGKRCANSGATRFLKSDVLDKDTSYECKTVTKEVKQYPIKKEVIEKARQEAFSMNKRNSVLVFNFAPDGECFYVLSEKHYLDLISYKKDSE